MVALLIRAGRSHADSWLDSRCSNPITNLPFCRGVATTAPPQVLETIQLVNSIAPDFLIAKAGDGNACTTRTCIESAKGVLCLALNGGVAPSSVLNRAVPVKGPSVRIDQFALRPPLSGLASVSNESLPGVQDRFASPLDLVLLDQTTEDATMFCLNGVASREHPPCFTQCVDIVTSACSRRCMPSIVPSENGVTYSRPLPCLSSTFSNNPVCSMRGGERYAVDIRMEPWAACYRAPFLVPNMPGSTEPQVCAGRVPLEMVELDLQFDCARVRKGLCDAGDTLPLSPMQDPFLQLSMALADYLQVNPMYVHPSPAGRWSALAYPPTINNNSPNRIVTAHCRVYMDGEDEEYEKKQLVHLLDKDGADEWQSFLQKRLILPKGATVRGIASGQGSWSALSATGSRLAGPAWGLVVTSLLTAIWLV